MAKKKGKNIHKLLKKKQLQQLKDNTPTKELEPATNSNQPKLEPKPKLKELPTGEKKPVLKTVVISAVIIIAIFAISFSAEASNYLDTFGDWLYDSLRLNQPA